jgi:predicted nucleotidyltransferase
MMNKQDRNLSLEFKQKLTSDIVPHIKKLIVFGSRAAGTASTDSDLDIAAIVDNKNPNLEKKMEDIAYEVMWEHDFKPIISLKLFAEKSFNEALKKGFSFYKHVVSEGVIL